LVVIGNVLNGLLLLSVECYMLYLCLKHVNLRCWLFPVNSKHCP